MIYKNLKIYRNLMKLYNLNISLINKNSLYSSNAHLYLNSNN